MAILSTGTNLRRPVIRDISICLMLFLASRAAVMNIHVFGLAAFAACFDMSISYIGVLLICMGLITTGSSILITKYLTASLLFWIYSHFFKKRSVQTDSIACAASSIVGSSVYIICSYSGFSEMINALAEGAAAGIMYIIFKRAGEFISTRSSRTSISKDELICVALCAGVCITGLSGIELPAGITLSGIAAAYVVMCASYNCPLSAAGSAGLSIGFMCSMSTPYAVSATGFYGLCAIFGSLLKAFGKFGAAVGFLGGASAALIYSRFGADTGINAPDVVIGSVLFILTPEKFHMRINDFFSKSMRLEALTSGERLRAYLCQKLNIMSGAFLRLGDSFKALSDIRLQTGVTEAADLFEDTARRVCRGCPMADECWEKTFNFTYRRMVSLLEQIESGGEITDMPKSISDKCIRSEAFVNEFIHVYEAYRQKELFKGDAQRSRDLAAALYKEFGDILAQTASSIEDRLGFRSEYEEELITELDKCGISLFEISVIEHGDDRLEIFLGLNNGAYVDKLIEIIKKVTGIEVEFSGENGGIVKLVTKPRYNVKTGLCAVPCDGCDISGDNTEIFETEDNRSFVIISDGMGCGYDARKESESIVRLLKEFVTAGFDAETAIRIINSSLCMQLDRERAAAIDLLYIDRTSGIAKLFKIGCAETFFFHGGAADIIFPVSLPAGMVNSIDLNPQTIRIHEGDILVMVTDGITQSGSSEWIKNEIKPELSAEENARTIIDKAIVKWGGKAFDDMTCVVIKIY
ncbi:MAG: SpoIIE family protein phosphatase [bacterium]|nr:SpoIIE family protein phosphatase [bacterium]